MPARAEATLRQAGMFGAGMSAPNRSTRLVILAQALLWLAASAGSALLVDWLYINPAYGMHWSSIPGALLFALVCLYAGAGCLISLIDTIRAGAGTGRRDPAQHGLHGMDVRIVDDPAG